MSKYYSGNFVLQHPQSTLFPIQIRMFQYDHSEETVYSNPLVAIFRPSDYSPELTFTVMLDTDVCCTSSASLLLKEYFRSHFCFISSPHYPQWHSTTISQMCNLKIKHYASAAVKRSARSYWNGHQCLL
jgi:hypothetical protein